MCKGATSCFDLIAEALRLNLALGPELMGASLNEDAIKTLRETLPKARR